MAKIVPMSHQPFITQTWCWPPTRHWWKTSRQCKSCTAWTGSESFWTKVGNDMPRCWSEKIRTGARELSFNSALDPEPRNWALSRCRQFTSWPTVVSHWNANSKQARRLVCSGSVFENKAILRKIIKCNVQAIHSWSTFFSRRRPLPKSSTVASKYLPTENSEAV